MSFQVNVEHELDISWLIALWFAIHGGDPSPEGGVLNISEETYALANGLVENLLTTYGRYGAHALSHAELDAQLRKMVGIHSIPPSLVPKLPPPPTGENTGPGGLTVPPSCWQVTPTQIRCWSPISRATEPESRAE